MTDHIDKIEIDYKEWYVYKISDTSYEYVYFPTTACGLDQQFKITISLEDSRYIFDAQEYAELYGSGGWNRWTYWDDKTRDILLKDCMDRIAKKDCQKSKESENQRNTKKSVLEADAILKKEVFEIIDSVMEEMCDKMLYTTECEMFYDELLSKIKGLDNKTS